MMYSTIIARPWQRMASECPLERLLLRLPRQLLLAQPQVLQFVTAALPYTIQGKSAAWPPALPKGSATAYPQRSHGG